MRWGLLIFAAIIGFILWLTAPLLYPVFDYFYGFSLNSNIEGRAQFGDMFGVVTSLFSIMSFVGVLFVLVHSQSYEEKKERPFLLTRSAVVPAATIRSDTVEKYSFTIKLKVENFSSVLAHSVQATPWFECRDKKYHLERCAVSTPIANSTDTDLTFNFNQTVDNTIDLLDALSSNKSVFFKVKLVFKNPANRSFFATNTYRISLNEGEHEAINCLRRGERDDKFWGGGKLVVCLLSEADDFVT